MFFHESTDFKVNWHMLSLFPYKYMAENFKNFINLNFMSNAMHGNLVSAGKAAKDGNRIITEGREIITKPPQNMQASLKIRCRKNELKRINK